MNNQEAYNKWAEVYDTNKNKTRDLDLEISQKVLEKYSFNDVLEIGCGTGKHTNWLMQKARTIRAMDFSVKMLEKLQEKVGDFPLEIIVGDIRKTWPIKDRQVDLAMTNLVLEHVENLLPIFEETARVLKPKGRFFISELHPFKQYLGSKARFEEGGEQMVLDCYTHHISDYLKAAEKAGFKCVELHEWFDEDADKLPPRLVSFVFELIIL